MVNGPVRVTLLTDTPTGPVLVICTSCAALVVPTVTEPKDRPVGETATEPDAVLDAVTVTAGEVATLPAASRATRAEEHATVLQALAYLVTRHLPDVTSAPRLAPSRVN